MALKMRNWQYSLDVTKTTAQKRRMKLTRETNPNDPKYEFRRNDG